MYLPAIVSVASWFEERRALATSIAVCGSGVGTFIFAPLTSYLLDIYTFNQTLLVMAGICLNGLIFACLLRTPPRHKANKTLKALHRAAAKVRGKVEAKTWLKEFFTEKIDWRLLRTWKFQVYCLSSFLGGVSSYMPYMYLQDRAVKEADIADLKAAFLISIVGIANIFGRLSTGMCSLTDKFCVDELFFYSSSCIVAGIATSLSVYCMDYFEFVIYAIFFGYTGGT